LKNRRKCYLCIDIKLNTQTNAQKISVPADSRSGCRSGGGNVTAQTLEPEFEGEVMGVYPDGSSKRLEKHTVQTRTGGSVLVAGFAVNKAKTKILIEGARANVRFDNARPIALVVRVKDNAADPMSIVRIFRMKPAKKRRTAVIAAAGTFHVTSNDMDYLSFSAHKYGESSGNDAKSGWWYKM